MPLYCFHCVCGNVADEMRPMSESDNPKKCECGKQMSRDFLAEHGVRRAACDTYPYHSSAMGVAPSQVAEAMAFDKQHGISTTYNSDGEPEFRSRGHRKRYCEAYGYVDRNAGFSDPQRAKQM